MRFFYGARSQEDLFYVDLVEQFGASLADFEFTPVVGGFVHEPAGECLAGNG